MLGNFSIGDYFKRSNPLCVGILTSENWMGMEPEKLYVTIHPEDSEAYRIWNDEIGLEESRIIRIEGNFWDIGEGPSGPNTEIFYDRGDEYGQDDPSEEMYPGGENERYLEVWNLVLVNLTIIKTTLIHHYQIKILIQVWGLNEWPLFLKT